MFDEMPKWDIFAVKSIWLHWAQIWCSSYGCCKCNSQILVALVLSTVSRCMDWMEQSNRILDGDVLTSLLVLLWYLWNTGNNEVLFGKQTPPLVALDYTRELQEEFHIHNLTKQLALPHCRRQVRWRHWRDKLWRSTQMPPSLQETTHRA